MRPTLAASSLVRAMISGPPIRQSDRQRPTRRDGREPAPLRLRGFVTGTTIAALIDGVASGPLPLALFLWTTSALAQTATPVAPSTPPRLIFVWFADGHDAPAPGLCGAATPPRYRCDFAASTDECRARVMRDLAVLYQDFDVQLVTSDPTPAPHFTVVVTSADASWCGHGAGASPGAARGLAPVNCAAAAEFGNTAYVFSCDRNPATCARRIAQEQAHLVGLDHASSPTDVMYPFETDSAAFRDRTFRTLTPRCGKATQNSYQLMLKRFGRRRRGVFPHAASRQRHTTDSEPSRPIEAEDR
jgi:hypothetical protein